MKLQSIPALSVKEALEIVGGLSNPSKMPWYGWSIPASACHTGSKLRQVEGSVCAKCYAHKGYYPFPRVQNALQRRLKALDHPQFVDAFVVVLTELFKGEDRFRWMDSGDLQSVEHLEKIVAIARRTPFIRHWISTKEAGIVSAFLKHNSLPDNLVVRISHPMVGQTWDKAPLGLPFATVGRDDDQALFQCPALRHQGNKCHACDACWRGENVNYPLH